MMRGDVAALGVFFYKQAHRKFLMVVAARAAGAMLGACLVFASCQTFLLSDDATFADAREAEGGAPDAGPDTAGCQGCPIAGQCVPADEHNGTNWCEVCAPQQSRGKWSYACPATEACNAMRRCHACEADECLIERACWSDGATKPDNACLFCDPTRDRLSWSLNTGDSCDDRNFCTDDDRCDRGTCMGGPPFNCDDDLDCTEHLCNTATASCDETIEENVCTIDRKCVKGSQINPDQICEECNPARNPRAYSARLDLPCDDGLTCTRDDKCGSSGVCAGTSVPDSRCPAGYCDAGGRCGGDLVAAGASHSCVLREGELFCFGQNDHGQLGDGTTTNRHRAVRVGTARDWSQVVAGNAHTCGRRGGALYCWGKDDEYGQLGNGEDSELHFLTPQRVGTGEDWGTLAAGGEHTCAIRQGALYCWGQNSVGQLGDGTIDNRHTPTRVGMDTDWIAVTAGYQHTCGLRGNDLYCWGDDSFSQLGSGTTNTFQRQPVPIGQPGGWSSISAGDLHTCGLRSGYLFCWGSNAYGKLNLSDTDKADEPTAVRSIQVWETIVCGGDHTCATQSGGDLYCWGLNDRRQLGPGGGTMPNSATPLPVGRMWTGLSTGRQHTCGIQEGVFRCWGANDSGQLGDGTTMDSATPVAVTGLP
jgi:alpha-tubulin suppressor-like RCC1 family protein